MPAALDLATTPSRFVAHTPESAAGKAADLLGDLWARHHGDIGPMVRTMAGSPAVLGGYLELSRAMKRSKLARPVSERISLAVQQRLGCAMCLSAHTSAARAAGVDEDEIRAARAGTSAEPAIAAIVGFALQVHSEPRLVDQAAIDDLRGHGWSDREILDVIGLVTLNSLTGTFNLIAGLEPEHDATVIDGDVTPSNTPTTITTLRSTP